MSILSHRERLQECISNSASIDRPPVALWRHFPVDDQSPGTLAEATIAFQHQFDFDLVKVTPASSFCLKDWGVEDCWEGNPEGTRRYTKYVIQRPQDWERLKKLDPQRAKYLSSHLTCLQYIRASLPNDIPIIQTIFSPLSQAKNLAGRSRLLSDIRKYPEAVQKGLNTIAETTRRFILSSTKIGIDGIFFAIQQAQSDELSFPEYRKYGIPNDLTALESTNSLWCNILHLHGQSIYFDIVSDYTAYFSILNWHDRETPPSLVEGEAKFNKAVCGGISQHTTVFGNQAQIQTEANGAINCTAGRHLILGTGCVTPIIAPYGNINAIRNSVELRK